MEFTTLLQKGSTLLLRLAATVIGLGVLALCVFLLPYIWTDASTSYGDYRYAVQAIVLAMYVSAVPFYVGLYKGWRVLDTIDDHSAFSVQTVTSLKIISRCAAAISLIYVASLPFFFTWADTDDAPGLMLIGLFLVGMPLIVSVAIGLLHRLLAEVVNIKHENDLTV